jgi:tetratricopeptide (TPR) repeat protein
MWPGKLTFIYPRWKLDASAWWQWLYPIATATVIAGTWIARRRIGKGPFAALTHFYIATSFLILAVAPFMTMYTFVADHWAYFGSLGIAALAASGFAGAMDRMEKEWGGPLEMGLGITLVCTLALLTWAQCGMYTDSETLWARTLAENPDCWAARSNLGMADLQKGNTLEAITEIREALRMNPANAQAHNNLAAALMQEQQIEQAIAEYREAVRLQPEYEDARYNFGVALLEVGRVNEAADEYRAALRLNPGDDAAHNGLGKALIAEGRTEEAIAEFGQSLRINPADADAQKNLARALSSQGRRIGPPR